MDRDRRAGFLEDRLAAGRVLPARGRRCRQGSRTDEDASVIVDKIASVTQTLNLNHELRLRRFRPRKASSWSPRSSTTRPTTTRWNSPAAAWRKWPRVTSWSARWAPRRALFGYSGHVPAAVKPGDVIQMLNIGGVMGICDSATPTRASPSMPRAGRGAAVPLSWRAHRCAGARRHPAVGFQRQARNPRRAGSGAGRHLHGSRQDRRGRGDRAHAPSRTHGRCVQGHRRIAAA